MLSKYIEIIEKELKNLREKIDSLEKENTSSEYGNQFQAGKISL